MRKTKRSANYFSAQMTFLNLLFLIRILFPIRLRFCSRSGIFPDWEQISDRELVPNCSYRIYQTKTRIFLLLLLPSSLLSVVEKQPSCFFAFRSPLCSNRLLGDVPFNNGTPRSGNVIARGSTISLGLCEFEGFQSDKHGGGRRNPRGASKWNSLISLMENIK